MHNREKFVIHVNIGNPWLKWRAMINRDQTPISLACCLQLQFFFVVQDRCSGFSHHNHITISRKENRPEGHPLPLTYPQQLRTLLRVLPIISIYFLQFRPLPNSCKQLKGKLEIAIIFSVYIYPAKNQELLLDKGENRDNQLSLPRQQSQENFFSSQYTYKNIKISVIPVWVFHCHIMDCLYVYSNTKYILLMIGNQEITFSKPNRNISLLLFLSFGISDNHIVIIQMSLFHRMLKCFICSINLTIRVILLEKFNMSTSASTFQIWSRKISEKVPFRLSSEALVGIDQEQQGWDWQPFKSTGRNNGNFLSPSHFVRFIK